MIAYHRPLARRLLQLLLLLHCICAHRRSRTPFPSLLYRHVVCRSRDSPRLRTGVNYLCILAPPHAGSYVAKLPVRAVTWHSTTHETQLTVPSMHSLAGWAHMCSGL
jgi:hypothetical protein